YRIHGEYLSDTGFGTSFDDRRGATLTFRADYRLRTNDELTLLAGVHDGSRGFGFAGTPGNSNGEREATFTTGFAQLRWRRQLNAGSEISVGYYHSRERAHEAWNAAAPPFFPVIPVDFDRNSVRDNVDFQHILAVAPALRIVWGAELRRDAIESQRLFAPTGEDSQSLARLYGNGEWRALDSLVLNGGAMLEKYSGRSAKVAPRLFANWHLTENHTLRVGGSRAYRAPSLFEEHGDMRFSVGGILVQQNFTPPGSLRPERIDAREVGYLGRFPAWHGTLDVRLYRDRIRDFIADRGVLSPLVPPPLFSPASAMTFNSSTAIRSRGIEAHLRVRPFESTDLIAGYARMHLRGAPGTLDRSAPRHSGTLTWIQRYPGRIASTLTVHRTGSYQWGGGARPTPAYTAYDARVSYRTRAFGWPAEFALVLLSQGRAHEELTWGDAQSATLVARQAYLTARLDF
ncbi:MAG TPA: TonB-dependent receptor, partial [Burkholderiales bacterium]|nr:TonB-dependent receptor [Burkholderiales bacterium]